MPVQMPRPLNKQVALRQIAAIEAKIANPNKLSTAYSERVQDVWDLFDLDASELCALREALLTKRSSLTSCHVVLLKTR
jgi:hypothetical protein